MGWGEILQDREQLHGPFLVRPDLVERSGISHRLAGELGSKCLHSGQDMLVVIKREGLGLFFRCGTKNSCGFNKTELLKQRLILLAGFNAVKGVPPGIANIGDGGIGAVAVVPPNPAAERKVFDYAEVAGVFPSKTPELVKKLEALVALVFQSFIKHSK